MDLRHVCRVFHPVTAKYTFFSSAHGTFPKIDPILGHKVNLNKYKKIEIPSCILSDHNTIKLTQQKTSSRKYSNNWRLNNTMLSVRGS
jgi:hypothetical protein